MTTEQVRYALAGCGSVSQFHVQAIQSISQAELVAVFNRTPEKAQSVSERTGATWHADYADMLSRSDVDVVILCTASGMHAPMALEAIEAGKHVVVEKPLALTLEDAREVIRSAKEKGIILSVISQRRFEPAHQLLKKMIDHGEFGKILSGEIHVRFHRTPHYYASADWRGTPEMDGGALMNQAIHSIDLLCWLLGQVQSVSGVVHTRVHAIRAEDTAVGWVQFMDGAVGLIQGSTAMYPGFAPELHIYGERGAVRIVGSDIVTWMFEGNQPPKPDLATAVGTSGASDPQAIGAYYHEQQLRDITEAILDGRSPLITGEDGYRALQVVLGIYESVKTGRTVVFSPEPVTGY
jgi:predicted dehydrogenase